MLIEIKDHPTKIIKNIPSKPGTYRMLDSSEKVLYVGKAKNLKKEYPATSIKMSLTVRQDC